MQESFRAGTIRRQDVFVTTKLWNTNHRPERVKPAFDASRRRLQIDRCRLLYDSYPICLSARATIRTRRTSAVRSSMIPA